MIISKFIEDIKQLDNEFDFIEYLEDYYSEIELLFYGRNYDELNEYKFEIEDLFLTIESNGFLNNSSSKVILSFLNLLGDFFERSQLKAAAQTILVYFNEIDENSVKNRLTAFVNYKGFNDSNYFISKYNEIIQYIIDAYPEEDFEYKIEASFVYFYLDAFENLSRLSTQIVNTLKNKALNTLKQHEFLNTDLVNHVISTLSINSFKNDKKRILGKIHDLEIESLNLIFNRIKVLNFIKEDSEYSRNISDQLITFNNIRNLATSEVKKLTQTKSDNVYRKLERGVKIIDSQDLLYMYLYSYGKKHKLKLDDAYAVMVKELEALKNVNIIDWGCGQALATFLLKEFLNKKSIEINFKEIILIEPSNLALQRGVLHLKEQNKQNVLKIKPLIMDLDSLQIKNITITNRYPTLNLFSNILDVPFFNLIELINKIKNTQKGINYFICISPNISNERNQRLDNFYNILKKDFYTKTISQRSSTIGNAKRYEKIFLVDFDKKM
jgi:hypothetical protein